jgi:hypothetical protein
LRLIFAGTVHRSQGMMLQRAVIDCRMKFLEHGQLYVARSGVKNAGDLCILLPESSRHQTGSSGQRDMQGCARPTAAPTSNSPIYPATCTTRCVRVSGQYGTVTDHSHP